MTRRFDTATKTPPRPLVLIIEDHRDTQLMYREGLEFEGFAVETASDGKAALARLHRGPAPAVIVTDLRMPRMTGFEFLMACQRDGYGSIPVVAMSGDPDAVGMASGEFAAILVKPVIPDALAEVLRALLKPATGRARV